MLLCEAFAPRAAGPAGGRRTCFWGVCLRTGFWTSRLAWLSFARREDPLAVCGQPLVPTVVQQSFEGNTARRLRR